MLKFSKSNAMSLLVLLSLSVFANADQDEKTGPGKKSTTNLVELYKVKSHATEHIKSLEAKLLATDGSDQEELLVEYAQSLLYYHDRHNKAPDAKAAMVSSPSAKGVNGKASKTVNSKGAFAINNIYRKALNAYKKASQLSLNKNRIKYTRKLSELAVKLQKKDELVQIFDELLQHGGDEKGSYLAHIDYADGLSKFKDKAAESQFLSAVNMRTPVDGVEANYRYANYLLNNGKPHDALSILEKFTFEERRKYVHVAALRQKVMYLLKLDTHEVDAEMTEIRNNLSKTTHIGLIPKYSGIARSKPKNILSLQKGYAFKFIHNNESDDSRGKYGNFWVKTPQGYIFSAFIINAAEVIYNEARGNSRLTRLAIAWSIRNRATIDMNDCNFYLGSESDPNVSVCRAETPDGPRSIASNIFKRYSCVVHGGTSSVGASQTQMNDTHVSIANLESSGILWEVLYVASGWIPDPSAPNVFLTNQYPEVNVSSGNPIGTQEWSKGNYCAENNKCKVRLGNIGGYLANQGNTCFKEGSQSHDYFFWGRKPFNHTLDAMNNG